MVYDFFNRTAPARSEQGLRNLVDQLQPELSESRFEARRSHPAAELE